jgi:hypothetical protein
MRGSRRIGLLALAVGCVFSFTAGSASARELVYTGNTRAQLLPDAQEGGGRPVRIGVGYVARVTDPPHLCVCLELCGETGVCVSVAVSPCAALEEVPAWRWR